MSKNRRMDGSELQGNAWVFACIANAQAAYRRVLAKTEVISDQQDSSLATGFFGKRPVFVFLWRPSMDPELVASIERLAILGGGSELEENLKQELLRQARQRRRGPPSRRPRGGMMTMPRLDSEVQA
jgi:hypothetical protein